MFTPLWFELLCKKSSNGLLKLFRRRSMMRAVESTEAAMEAEQQRESGLLLEFDEIQKRIPPDTQGLDLETKRLINFMILSFAQQLFLHFSEDGIAAMSQEAGEKSVGAINYGSKSECDNLLARIAKLTERYDALTDFADNASNCQLRASDEGSIVGASSSIRCALVPPMPKELTPALRGLDSTSQGLNSVLTSHTALRHLSS